MCFCQSLQFFSSSDVLITGYIWQKYQDGIHDELSRGFLLPDAVSSKTTEAYRYKEEDIEVIGWYVEATLRQNFDFSNYPFDHKDVKIRILHQDFNRHELERPVFLIPDLAEMTPDGEAPVMPDEDGKYPVPAPGVTTEFEYEA